MTEMKYNTARYYKNRYWENPKFRKDQIKRVRDWQNRNPDKVKQYRKNAVERYGDRDEKEIERRRRYQRKQYLKRKKEKKW